MKRFVFLGTLCLLLSCGKGIQQADFNQLKAKINQATKDIESIDTNQLLERVSQLDSSLQVFRSDAFTDTLELDFARKIDSAIVEMRDLKAIVRLLPSMYKALALNREQLAELEKNVEQGRGTKAEQQKVFGTLGRNIDALTAMSFNLKKKADIDNQNINEHLRSIQKN